MERTRGDLQKARPVDFLEGTHYPRYYFADQVVTIADRQDFAEKLCEESFSPAVAFVARPAFVPARGVVRRVSETANRATLDVEAFGSESFAQLVRDSVLCGHGFADYVA